MEARRKALGRGLRALIAAPEELSPDLERSNHATSLPIDAIQSNPYQPREVFEDRAVDELAESIRKQGLLQPLLVRRADDGYQLIAGERRLRAAQRAGLSEVPVTLRVADDRESLELALVENLQREDLNPVEEAHAYRRLSTEFGLTQEDIAAKIGKSRSAVANTLRLLSLPAEVLRQVQAGALSAGHARSILGIQSPSAQIELARELVRQGLSVRDTERRARKQTGREVEIDRQAVEDKLTRTLGTRVRLRPNKDGSGRIEIEYYSLTELNGLVDRLSEERTN